VSRALIAALSLAACTDDPPLDPAPTIWNRVEFVELAPAGWSTGPGTGCFDRAPLDVDVDKAGGQYDCAAWFTETGAEVIIPACTPSTNEPCWSIIRDPDVCTLLSHYGLAVNRSESQRVSAECVVQ
jgi:hypothetical protein